MKEKVIVDKKVINKIVRKDASFLIIQYNEKSKRAWYLTDNMKKRKAIDLSRVINL